MSKYRRNVSGRASLALLAKEREVRGIWECVEAQVKVAQKTVKHTPLNKLKDCFINIVAGGQGLVEINTRVRRDRGLCRAFGREACAEQSTVSQTLNCCGQEQVEQLRTALRDIYRANGQGYRHAYERQWQLVDIDMTGVCTGRQAEGATKGYFEGRPHRRGRQVGRVLATRYGELVTERLYSGRTQLRQSLQELVKAAQEVLELDEKRRTRTLLRMDSGGGCQADIDWMLEQGYGVLTKLQGAKRVEKLAKQVERWVVDPRQPHRAAGWVETPIAYTRPTRQVIVRVQTAHGGYAYGALVTNAPEALLLELADVPKDIPDRCLWAMAYAYDQRGGGLETANKGDKQGLGFAKRNKRGFAAQEILLLLAQLAHNLYTWVGHRLSATCTTARSLGILRLCRDVFSIPGYLTFDPQGLIRSLTLNASHPWARLCYRAFAPFARQHGWSLILRKF